jgi:hypothetical protein
VRAAVPFTQVTELEEPRIQLCFSQIGIWLIQWELRTFREFPSAAVLSALLASSLSVFRSRAALQLEIITEVRKYSARLLFQ